MIAVASCGGGDSGNSEDGTDDTVAPADEGTTDDGSVQASTESQPINGPIVSLLSPDLGLYAIDRTTNEVRDLTMDGVDFTDRQTQPILIGDSAYMLTATTIDGQTAANEVGIGKVDLATGEGVEIVQLGAERQSDEDPDLIVFELVGGANGTIWATRGPFAESDVTYLSFDSSTGAAGVEFKSLPYEVTADDGTMCTGDIRDEIILSDGRIAGLSNGWPTILDPTTGEIEPLVEWCGFNDEPNLSDLLEPDDINDYAITETGEPIPLEKAPDLLEIVEPRVAIGAYVEGDGSLWWIFNPLGLQYQDGDEFTSAVMTGIIEFDLATNSIINVWPLVDNTITFEVDDGGTTSVSSLTQAGLRFLNGRLWIMDLREDAPLRVFDPATGEVTAIDIRKGDGVDFTTATLVSSDPDSIWLEVTQSTVTSDDGESRSSQGVKFLDQVDPATMTFVSSIEVSSIIGF